MLGVFVLNGSWLTKWFGAVALCPNGCAVCVFQPSRPEAGELVAWRQEQHTGGRFRHGLFASGGLHAWNQLWVSALLTEYSLPSFRALFFRITAYFNMYPFSGWLCTFLKFVPVFGITTYLLKMYPFSGWLRTFLKCIPFQDYRILDSDIPLWGSLCTLCRYTLWGWLCTLCRYTLLGIAVYFI